MSTLGAPSRGHPGCSFRCAPFRGLHRTVPLLWRQCRVDHWHTPFNVAPLSCSHRSLLGTGRRHRFHTEDGRPRNCRGGENVGLNLNRCRLAFCVFVNLHCDVLGKFYGVVLGAFCQLPCTRGVSVRSIAAAALADIQNVEKFRRRKLTIASACSSWDRYGSPSGAKPQLWTRCSRVAHRSSSLPTLANARGTSAGHASRGSRGKAGLVGGAGRPDQQLERILRDPA